MRDVLNKQVVVHSAPCLVCLLSDFHALGLWMHEKVINSAGVGWGVACIAVVGMGSVIFSEGIEAQVVALLGVVGVVGKSGFVTGVKSPVPISPG